MKKRSGYSNNTYCMMIVVTAMLIITVAFAGCTEQKEQKSQSVSGIPNLQISLEKNISVRQYLRTDGSGIYDTAPFYYVTFVFTNTGDKPINLKDYLFILADFDPKTNTYVERVSYLSPFSFNLRPNLGPGASYRADPRDNGVYVNYYCGGEAEKYKFIIKKSSDSATYPPPPPTTLYSMEYFINGDDCINLDLYSNMGLAPAAYQKYMDELKVQIAKK